MYSVSATSWCFMCFKFLAIIGTFYPEKRYGFKIQDRRWRSVCKEPNYGNGITFSPLRPNGCVMLCNSYTFCQTLIYTESHLICHLDGLLYENKSDWKCLADGTGKQAYISNIEDWPETSGVCKAKHECGLDGMKRCLTCTRKGETTCVNTMTRPSCDDIYKLIGEYCLRRETSDWKSWLKANETCRREGGHLVIIDSKEKNDDVLELAMIKGLVDEDTWIGLIGEKRSHNFLWVDGRKITYTNWDEYQPDHLQISPNEICGQIIYGRTGTWNDAGCEKELPFICEKNPN